MEDKQQNATVSPSLIYQGNFNDPLPETFNRIYMHLEDDTRDKVTPCCSGDAKIEVIYLFRHHRCMNYQETMVRMMKVCFFKPHKKLKIN